ncbi:hypothetical protein [Stenotrophomonas virus Jojan60]|nr:hypothetical protein [Stenotrophomonas virus Jojan60]
MDEYRGHIVEFRTRRAADKHAAMWNRRIGAEAAYVVAVQGIYQVRFRTGFGE